ncbi:helix-turn-helix protein [anaerobic digester metagenome]
MDYGRNLKLARKWAGITQIELAKKSKVAAITIRQYETGKRTPSLDIWMKIANALHLSLDELNNAEDLPTEPFDPNSILDGEEKNDWRDSPYIQDDEPEFHALRSAFNSLNPTGQHVAVERVEELTKILDYQKGKEPPQPE